MRRLLPNHRSRTTSVPLVPGLSQPSKAALYWLRANGSRTPRWRLFAYRRSQRLTRILAAMAVLAVAVTPMGGNDDHRLPNVRQGEDVQYRASRHDLRQPVQGMRPQTHTIRIQGLAADGVAPPPPTPVPPPTPTVEAQPIYTGACPALIVSTFGWAGCAISYCESHWNPNATGAIGERGWFQINPHAHSDATYDPAGNVAAAWRISSGGTNWSAWSVRGVLSSGRCPNGEGLPF